MHIIIRHYLSLDWLFGFTAIYLSFSPSVCLSIFPPVCLSSLLVCLYFQSLSACLSVYMWLCLFLSVCVWPCLLPRGLILSYSKYFSCIFALYLLVLFPPPVFSYWSFVNITLSIIPTWNSVYNLYCIYTHHGIHYQSEKSIPDFLARCLSNLSLILNYDARRK